MDKGEVADIGSHAELISRCSKYQEMWNAQAQYYV
jgi:ABC-type multidrug transport system fused ATPase/permease subunit